ncbi:MAG: DUF2934 domain-containing protein [Candidatus Omnitrophica bacterium]|nr:DUF2934 domain-containing protein [Candidatus Omnitrophota bacterium]
METFSDLQRSKYSQEDLDKIRTKAYYIWEQKGKPTTESALDHWLQAERELRRAGMISKKESKKGF